MTTTFSVRPTPSQGWYITMRRGEEKLGRIVRKGFKTFKGARKAAETMAAKCIDGRVEI